MGPDNENSVGAKVSNEGLSSKVRHLREETVFYHHIVRELHKFLEKLLPLIMGGNYKEASEQMNKLVNKFTSSEDPKKLEHIFEKYRKLVSVNIINGIKDLQTKEKEFKDIIKMLSEGIASMSYDNIEFNASILGHSEKINELNRIDDILKIKEGLKSEVGQIGEVVKKKVDEDNDKLKILSDKVSVLNDDLKKAEAASMIDKLSGAFNRLAFDKHINSLVEKMAIRLATFSVIMIDIDNFKNINDTYGHLVGDSVIVATVQKCKSVMRKNDFIARYGGEEFVIVLEGSPLNIAKRKAEEICKVISETDFVIDEQKPNELLRFTVSLGTSSFVKGDTVYSLVNRADKALYKAKKTGKNRVVAEDELD